MKYEGGMEGGRACKGVYKNIVVYEINYQRLQNRTSNV